MYSCSDVDFDFVVDSYTLHAICILRGRYDDVEFIQRSRVRFPALPGLLSLSETGSTQPREHK
jgi:hypothetical protein